MPTRLRKVELTALVDRSGADDSKVSSDSALFNFYKHGATVSTTGPTVIGTNTAISVYNAGRLVVGDTVQKGTDSSATATVDTITSPTAIILDSASGTLSLSRGDRLVVTSNRPTIYDESSGVHAATGSPTITANSEGQIAVYSVEPFVDVVVSGGTPSISATGFYDVLAGYDEPRPHVSILDHGGMNETALRRAIASLGAQGGIVGIPDGTITLSSTLTIADNAVHLRGEGLGATIIKAAAVNPAYHLISIENNYVILENFEIDGRADRSGTPGNYDCVHMHKVGSNMQNNIITNCIIHSAQRYGIYVNDTFDHMFRDVNILYCFITGFFAETDGNGNNTHLYFHNCEFDGNNLLTIYPTAPEGAPAVHINNAYSTRFLDCRFESNRGGTLANGLLCEGATAVTLINCHFEIQATATDWNPVTRPTSYAYFENSRGMVMIGCTFNGSTVASLCPTRAVYLNGSHYWTIVGGKMESLDTSAIEATASSPGFHSNVYIVAGTGGATAHTLGEGSCGVHEGLISVPRYTTANRPTASAALNGSMYYDTTTDDLMVCAGGSWVVVGTQT